MVGCGSRRSVLALCAQLYVRAVEWVCRDALSESTGLAIKEGDAYGAPRHIYLDLEDLINFA